MTSLPTGAVTFLFTDIEGSTKLWEEHHEAMQQAVTRHDELLRNAIDANEGYVFSTGGDAFAAAYSDPARAVGTALEAQGALGSESWDIGPVLVRMGIHSGVAHERDGDYFGPTVNRTARIMAAGHGGQVLLSQATCELVSGRLPDGASLESLGSFRLKDLGEPESISQLVHPSLAEGFPPLRTLDTHLNNLPVELSSFVGREEELAEAIERLGSSRLVTLTGVGGSGKTRLALQTAAEGMEHFPDGVWLAELAGLADSGDIDHWVVQELGISQSSQPPRERLTEFFSPRTALLVLDNCEHLITPAARLADALLKASPALKILATSREGLGIRGEQLMQVPSLEVPDEHAGLPEDSRYPDAMELFAERATSADAHFELTKENAAAVADICRRLDGMPLAIELAAARARLLPPEQIADRLDDSFRLLTGGSRTALPRQQTLRATIDWSYELLTEEERAVFDRLSVFREGFTLEAAEAIVSGDGVDELGVFDAIASLVDKSMLQSDSTKGRFMMLETLRQYALDRITESGTAETWREKHATYYADMADEAYDATRNHRQAEWFGLLVDDHENYRTATNWAIGSDHLDLAGRLARGLWWFWLTHSEVPFAEEVLTTLIDSDEFAPDLLAQLYHARAWTAIWHDPEARTGLEDARKAVALARETGNEQLLARTSVALVTVLGPSRQFEEQDAAFAEAYDIGQRTGDEWVRGRLALNYGYGFTFREADRHDADKQAERWYEAAMRHFAAAGTQMGRAHSLGAKGQVRMAQQDYDTAATLFEEAYPLHLAMGDRDLGARTLAMYALLNLGRGKLDLAMDRLRQAENLLVEVGVDDAFIHYYEAALLVELGDLLNGVEALRVGYTHLGNESPRRVDAYTVVLARYAATAGDFEGAARLIGISRRSGQENSPAGAFALDKTLELLDSELVGWREIADEWENKSDIDRMSVLESVLSRLEADLA